MNIIAEREIKYNDLKQLWSICDTQEEVSELSNYLKENDLVITIREGGDRSCGMTWEEYYLEGQIFSPMTQGDIKNSLLKHVRTFGKLVKLSKTKEFEEYKLLRQKYEDVYQKVYLKK